jgi:hypothetical protein
MNDEQKAQKYSQLTYNFDRLANEISSIKGESIDLNQDQQLKIRQLMQKQNEIMSELQRMMN